MKQAYFIVFTIFYFLEEGFVSQIFDSEQGL